MKEHDIRPAALFDEYLRLTDKDTQTYFSDVERVEGVCPGCCGEGRFAFEKGGFAYQSCPQCYTLFVNPRPVAEAFNSYYTESPSAEFWATTFYKETADARREKIWRPKAQLIWEKLGRLGAQDRTVVDIGGGFGIFAEVMQEISGRPPVVIEPGPALAAACRRKGFAVVEKFLEHVDPIDLPPGPKVFVSFELFEHLHDPARFMEQLRGLMQPEDIFIFTTLSSAGVDIQILWENSKSVSPPHHLNFLNPKSVSLLMRRCGFEVLEVTTPGKLDVDILLNNRENVQDRFWQMLLDTSDDNERNMWQRFLADSGASSHMMIVARPAC